jgi:hypothetical protein
MGDTNAANNVTVLSSQVFSPGETYLLFGELVNDGVDDDLRLWVNPSDLSNPTSDAPVIASLDIGSGWVGENAAFTLRQLQLFADTPPGSQFIFDELRFGSSIDDVLPFAAASVPEPATWIAWMVAACGVLLGMRRVRR